MTCTSFGPWTPRVSVSSMSAVRLGPVMKLMTAPRSSVAPSACQSSRNTPTCAGDSRHDLRHLRERRHAVKDAADLLELATEALERLRPALRELGPDRLGFLARVLGPSGWRRGEEAARLAHLGADPRHELLPRG